ncbi:MAG: ATP-dependent 6-phosphofructokinase [Armatimonadetes bacterium]|nr:ATP-dependent 6-phosphofructokinase [Armatimonadota bacterium]
MKIGVLTGGGDCPGLNPAIRGFVMRAIDYGDECWGLRDGWRGLVENLVESEPLTVGRVEEIIRQGGTMLGSSRTNPFKKGQEADLEKCLRNIRSNRFDVIAALGGDDTLGVANRLYHEHGIKTVGIPKTMDNDLSETDYTFGFDSAVAVATDALDRLKDTAKSHSRVMVLEVMGRHAGWVALYTGIAGGADWILMPEQMEPADSKASDAATQRSQKLEAELKEMAQHLKAARARGKNYGLIVVSEGVQAPTQSEAAAKVDSFGHVILAEQGIGRYVAQWIESKTGFETRDASIGHIQRGGAPTVFDRVLATRLGVKAADCVHEGQFGVMVATRGNEIVAVDLRKAVGISKTVPLSLYNELKTLFNK